jgi:hypothetical protein
MDGKETKPEQENGSTGENGAEAQPSAADADQLAGSLAQTQVRTCAFIFGATRCFLICLCSVSYWTRARVFAASPCNRSLSWFLSTNLCTSSASLLLSNSHPPAA